MPERTTDVVIVGAGPAGLMLAAELLPAGVRPLLQDRRPAPDDTPRANGLVGQVVRVLDLVGLYRPLAVLKVPQAALERCCSPASASTAAGSSAGTR